MKISKFLVTWQKINWIGFSRIQIFWLVVFLWSNLWRRDSWDDSVITINLCWYFWGGGLYPFRRFVGVKFVWNIDNRRPAVGYTVRQNLIWSVTTQRRDCHKNQAVQLSLLIATEEELISLIYLQIDQWTPCYCAP